MALIDEIIDIINNGVGKNFDEMTKRGILEQVYTCKFLMERRKEILEKKPNGCIYPNQIQGLNYPYHNSAIIHFELSDPNNKNNWGWGYDGIPLDRRLNNFHNVLLISYAKAKKKGAKELEAFLRQAFGGVCLDMRSEKLIDYVNKNLDDKVFFDFSAEGKNLDDRNGPYDKLSEYVNHQFGVANIELSEENLRAYLRKNAEIIRIEKDKKLDDKAIDAFIEFFDNVFGL